MIVVNLFGGFANQLFQYALGRYLQVENGCEVKYLPHDYWIPKLDELKCEIEYCSDRELKHVRKEDHLIRLWTRKLESAVKPDLKKTVIGDYGHPFNPEILSIRHDCQLIGYWQTYLAADAIREVLLREIQPLRPLSSTFDRLRKQVQGTENSVAMHIRRGDYLNKEIIDVHGITPLSYYVEATALLTQKLGNIQVFVFSDDIEWAKDNVNWLNNPVFLQSENHLEDFFLMSECNHNIIANSTFSWWAAWLNQQENQLVIRPENWFASRRFNEDNFIPQNWITL